VQRANHDQSTRGFAGGAPIQLADVDTARLPDAARPAIERRVQSLGSGPPDRAVGSDLLEYEIVVESDQGRRVVTWTDDGGPSAAPVRDLIAEVQQVR